MVLYNSFHQYHHLYFQENDILVMNLHLYMMLLFDMNHSLEFRLPNMKKDITLLYKKKQNKKIHRIMQEGLRK